VVKHIYCISGLGADHRVFQKLFVEDAELHYIEWLQPQSPTEPLDAYADRMVQLIKHDDAILLGVSFGGMMAIELAKRIKVRAVILIASIKSHQELPWWMKSCGVLKLDQLLPRKPLRTYRGFRLIRPLQNYFLGASTTEEKKIANEFRDKVDPVYLKWSINKVLNWKNNWVPGAIYHIHGDRDKLFPIKKIRPTHVIRDGGHFMIMSKYTEISEIICEISDLC
jgi:pimeloyl-ACP methyl ester carboxylesterase